MSLHLTNFAQDRVYNPNTGRFLTTDPILGGNDNTYTYPVDPINLYDLSGTFSWGHIWSAVVQAVTHPIATIHKVVTATVWAYHHPGRAAKIVASHVASAARAVAAGARAAAKQAAARNWAKVASGLASIAEGGESVDAGVAIATFGGAKEAAADDTSAGIVEFGGLAVGYGFYLQGAGAVNTVRGLGEPCPKGGCGLASQSNEFFQDQVNTFSFGRARGPIW